MKQTYHRRHTDDPPALMRRLEEARAAIAAGQFEPIHAADLLDAAEVLDERRDTAAKIVQLVASGRGLWAVRVKARRPRRAKVSGAA